MDEKKRAYIYRVLTAAGAVAVGYGLLSQEELGLWLQLAGAALLTGGNALAAKNTNRK